MSNRGCILIVCAGCRVVAKSRDVGTESSWGGFGKTSLWENVQPCPHINVEIFETIFVIPEMLPTPSTDHVDFERIYEPAEDSYLLLDTLSSESEKAFLRERFSSLSQEQHIPPPFVVEIGTGSGVIISFVDAHVGIIFGRSDILTAGLM